MSGAPPVASPISVTFSLLRAYRLVAGSLELRLAASTGLSFTAGEALARLAASAEGQLSMIELAAATGLSRSGVSRVVDRLEERQLVLRRTPLMDRRTVTVEVTDAGAELMLEVLATFERSAIEHVARFLTTEDLAILQLRLEKITAGMKPHRPAAKSLRAGAESATCC